MNKPQADQITLETRIIAGLVVVVLVLAFLSLYVWPGLTDRHFAWTILPHTSAILIGAGYLAGGYFFVRVLFERKWHRVQAGFPAITLFTVVMLAATVLHWSRFHHGSPPFYLWLGIYIVTPILVPFLWWRNRAGLSPALEAHDMRFPAWVRGLLGLAAIAGLIACLVVFIKPAILINLAPWKLTPLTARVFSGWMMLTLATVLTIALDGRWSATRILLESALFGLVLTLVAMPRMWPDLNAGKPITYVFIVGAALAFLALFLIRIGLDIAIRNRPAGG